MAAVRSGTDTLSVLAETTAFNTKEAAFEADKLQVTTWNSNTSLMHEAIENQAARTQDFGKHENALGLAHTTSSFGFSTYCFSLGTAAGDGDTPVKNAVSDLVGSCVGCVPIITDGDTVKAASSPTTTSVPQTTGGNLAAGKFLAHTVGGVTYVRPILSYATDTATLAMALPNAPTAGDVLQGQINFQLSENANAHIIQGDILKRNTTNAAEAGQMYEVFGCVGNMTMPATSVSEAQGIDFTYQIGNFTRYNQKTRIAPASRRPVVNAGGEFLLGKYGNTAGLPLKFLNVEMALGRTYTPDPRANEDTGIGGWILTEQDTSVSIIVHDDQAMPTGFSAGNFPASFGTGGVENRYHLMLAFGGKVAGKIFAMYFPCLQLVGEPEDTDVNGVQAWKLTFSLVSGLPSGLGKLWIAQI